MMGVGLRRREGFQIVSAEGGRGKSVGGEIWGVTEGVKI